MGCIGTVQIAKALISLYFTSALRTSRRDFNFLILSWIIGLTRIMSWVWTLTFSHHMRMQQMIRIPGFFATTMTLRSDSPVIVVPLDTNHISGIDFIMVVGDIIGHILSKKMLPLMHFEGINFEELRRGWRGGTVFVVI